MTHGAEAIHLAQVQPVSCWKCKRAPFGFLPQVNAKREAVQHQNVFGGLDLTPESIVAAAAGPYRKTDRAGGTLVHGKSFLKCVGKTRKAKANRCVSQTLPDVCAWCLRFTSSGRIARGKNWPPIPTSREAPAGKSWGGGLRPAVRNRK